MKINYFLNLILLLLIPKLSVGQSCLKAHYSFDGNAQDLSGNGNHASVFGATLTSDRLGNLNSAYEFDGVSGYIDLNSAFDYRERTINLWFKTNSINNAEPHIYISDNSSLNYGFTQIKNVFDSGTPKIITNACVAGNFAMSTISIADWHMITLVIASDSVRHYFDSKLVHTSPLGNIHSIDGHSTALLGTSRLFNRFFSGKIDEVKIFDCALDPLNINGLYTGLYTKFNEETTFHLFPNPATSIVTVQGLDYTQNSLALYNIIGDKINLKQTQNKIDMASLSSGVYVLKIMNKNDQVLTIKKIIKN